MNSSHFPNQTSVMLGERPQGEIKDSAREGGRNKRGVELLYSMRWDEIYFLEQIIPNTLNRNFLWWNWSNVSFFLSFWLSFEIQYFKKDKYEQIRSSSKSIVINVMKLDERRWGMEGMWEEKEAEMTDQEKRKFKKTRSRKERRQRRGWIGGRRGVKSMSWKVRNNTTEAYGKIVGKDSNTSP